MTRNEILLAINKAFGANAWAVVGYWNIQIETVPARQLILGDVWVKKLSDGEMTADEFERALRGLQGSHWMMDTDGTLTCVLN